MINIIRVTVPKVRATFPGIRFYLGNGGPQLMEEFLRHKLSPDLFDVLGNESASFERLPESQPIDFVANNPAGRREAFAYRPHRHDHGLCV